MSDTPDQTAETKDTSAEVPVDELTLLKKQADTLQIKYHPSIGVDSLRAKIAEALNDEPETKGADPVVLEKPVNPLLAKAQRRKVLRDDALRLIRLRITNLNPQKKDLHGEIFTVGNRHIGDVKRFVSYGEVTEEGTHVEHVIYKQLKMRKFLQVKTRKDPRHPGQMIIDQKWVPEFALEVLPQLTEEELKELARTQAASGSLND